MRKLNLKPIEYASCVDSPARGLFVAALLWVVLGIIGALVGLIIGYLSGWNGQKCTIIGGIIGSIPGIMLAVIFILATCLGVLSAKVNDDKGTESEIETNNSGDA